MEERSESLQEVKIDGDEVGQVHRFDDGGDDSSSNEGTYVRNVSSIFHDVHEYYEDMGRRPRRLENRLVTMALLQLISNVKQVKGPAQKSILPRNVIDFTSIISQKF